MISLQMIEKRIEISKKKSREFPKQWKQKKEFAPAVYSA